MPRVAGASWYQEGVLRQGTFSERQSYWAESWTLATDSTDHLVLGHGINSLVIGQSELPGTPDTDIAGFPELTVHGPHSQYVRTFVEEGLLGVALLLAWIGGSIVTGVRQAWRAGQDRSLIAAAAAALISVAIVSFVDDTLRDPPTFVLVALLAGLLVGRSTTPTTASVR
jgi:O-antigen ligase